MDMPILPGFQYPLDQEMAMFACLEPGTARAVLLGATVSAFEEDEDFEIPEDEVACKGSYQCKEVRRPAR